MPVGGEDDTIMNASTRPDTNAPAAARAANLIEGTDLVAGRYRVVRWLGAGGMGRVYEAIDTELDERIALKVLHSALTEETLERFRREVKLTRRIQHRNVARMFDIGEHGPSRFLTMELIEGVSLTRELGGEMAWPRLRGLAIQLCAGLAAAHAAGVVHRDLKPDNIMIERGTDRIVITDFGIARGGDESGVTQVGALVGTPRYMAPEQLAGMEVDHRADVFSLGVILYELATGARPWPGDSAVAIAVAQATQAPRPFMSREVPAALGALIAQCLEIDPARRPANAVRVGDAIASGAPLAPLPESVPPLRRVATPAGRPAHSHTPSPAPPPLAEHTTVAVLPVTCGPGDEYLAEGLLDDLVDTLSSTGSLRVRPAGMVRSRGDLDLCELGRALDVDHIVTASLRRTPLGLRVAARLISVADGFQIWAHHDDCSEAEILSIAEHLGRGVATALSARASGGDRPTDPRAVDLYLRARAELRRFWGEYAQNAADLLEQAAAHAPSSPPILGALAYATAQAWILRGTPELARRAHEAIERGLATGHGEAFLASGTFQLNQGDCEGAAAALGLALVRAPMSAPAHEAAGKILIEIAAVAEGRHHLETALALDPGRTNVILAELGRLDALEGNWDGAAASCRQLLGDPDPSAIQIGAVLEARIACWRGDRQAMTAAAARFAPRAERGGHLMAFVQRATLTGEIDADQWTELDQLFTQPDAPRRLQVLGLQLMAEFSIVFGHPELTLRALDRAADMGLIDVTWLDGCPLFAPFAGDLRWRALRDEIARRASGMLATFHAAAGIA